MFSNNIKFYSLLSFDLIKNKICNNQTVNPVKVPIADPKLAFPKLSPITLPKNNPATTMPVTSKPRPRYFISFGDMRDILSSS